MADLGRGVYYGIGKESTPGTAVAATHWFNQLSADINPAGEVVNNESAWGNLVRTNSSSVMRNWVEGSLEEKLTADRGGMLLLGAFGGVSTADNADANAAVKDHTFNLGSSISGQSFTLWRKDSVQSMQFPLARIGEFELAFALDDYVRLTANFLARKGVVSASTPAQTDESEFVPKHITIKTATTAAGLGAASAIGNVESLTITVNPNIEADWEFGNASPASISSRGYEIEFEMTKRYVDTTYESAWINGTALAFQVTATNTDVTIGTAANPKLVVTAPKFNITDYSRSEDLDAPLTETFTGTIHYSPADTYALRAVLTNTTASY